MAVQRCTTRKNDIRFLRRSWSLFAADLAERRCRRLRTLWVKRAFAPWFAPRQCEVTSRSRPRLNAFDPDHPSRGPGRRPSAGQRIRSHHPERRPASPDRNLTALSHAKVRCSWSSRRRSSIHIILDFPAPVGPATRSLRGPYCQASADSSQVVS